MFEPGTHEVDVNVGYYTQIVGLGRKPDDTKLRNFYSPNGSTNYEVGALNNFWRGVENVGLGNTQGPTMWAVSQAAPMRRVVNSGDLNLFMSFGGPAGYASGGYISDSDISGLLAGGSQQ